ncbi:hypothetical protein N9N28_08970 [Rubripirellula amarantea]|nr:hypothetical protein [Rubripirellula amarantea]
MPLSFNEIRSNSIEFAKEWAGESRENGEVKNFWDQFLRIFGHNRYLIASLEETVKKIKVPSGFIDVFMEAVLLAGHRSAGKDLTKAASQAFECTNVFPPRWSRRRNHAGRSRGQHER